MLIALNKPYGVLCQFTSDDGKKTLADFVPVPHVYAAGRLDFDSEGLVLLTDDGALQHAIADPKSRLTKRYWAQVEGVPDAATLARLADGIDVGTGHDRFRARPASAHRLGSIEIAERAPPIRFRAHLPTAWIEVALSEGRNRQVRRMTAALGHPTLRLIRRAIGDLDLAVLDLAPGEWRAIEPSSLGVPSLHADTNSTRAGARRRPPASTAGRRRRYGD